MERACARHIARNRVGNAAAKRAPGGRRDIWATARAYFRLPQPRPRIARLMGSPPVDSREKHEGKRITGEAPVTMTGLSLFVSGRGYGSGGAEIPAHRAPYLGPHRGRGLLPLQGRQGVSRRRPWMGLERDRNSPCARHSTRRPRRTDRPWRKRSRASCGMWQRLRVSPETLQALAKKGIEAEILQTEAAVKRFNELRENLPVGGLFHSTC